MRHPSGFKAKRFVMIAAVVAISTLGNARLLASEKPGAADAGASRMPRVAGKRMPTDASVTTAADATDDGRVVPAIYAWDPDVRFVYHRHVSKWM